MCGQPNNGTQPDLACNVTLLKGKPGKPLVAEYISLAGNKYTWDGAKVHKYARDGAEFIDGFVVPSEDLDKVCELRSKPITYTPATPDKVRIEFECSPEDAAELRSLIGMTLGHRRIDTLRTVIAKTLRSNGYDFRADLWRGVADGYAIERTSAPAFFSRPDGEVR